MQSPGISREASRPVSPSSESSSEVLPWSERRRVFGRRSKRALGAMSCGGFSTASSIASSGPPSSKSWRLPMTKGALATGMTGSRRTLRSNNLRRRHPEASPVEIEMLLGRWYTAEPMPEHPAMPPGDCRHVVFG